MYVEFSKTKNDEFKYGLKIEADRGSATRWYKSTGDREKAKNQFNTFPNVKRVKKIPGSSE